MTPLLKDRVRLIRALEDAVPKVEEKFKADKDIVIKVVKEIRNDINKQFLSLSQEMGDISHVSFAKNIEDKNNNTKRVKTTLRRYIRRNLEVGEDKMKDVVLDELGKHVVAQLSIKELEKKITIYKGVQITEQYKKTTIGSCMTGNNAFCTEVYALNPDVCQLYMIGDSCRALVWKADCGTMLIDHIYGYDHDARQTLENWAVSKGIVKLPYATKQYYVTAKYNEFFPHIDIFVFGWMKPGEEKIVILSNKSDREKYDMNVSFYGTSGKFEILAVCKKCGTKITGKATTMKDKPRDDGLCKTCAV